MRRRILIIAFFAISLTVRAQQDPQFSQNMFNHMTVNPAFAGMHGNWVVSGIYRNQWQKMPGAPETYAFNVDAPLRIRRMDGGIGLNMMSDKVGMVTNLHFMVNYSYKHTFDFGVLSVGAKVGIVNAKIEGDYYIPDGGDRGSGSWTRPEDDPALDGTAANVSKLMFDAGAGVFLTGDKYYAGVSVSHLPGSSMTIGQTGKFFWYRHMFLTGGYTLALSPKIDAQPSVFIGTDFVSSQYNLNANFIYNKRYWAGVSYRYEEAVAFMGGMELKGGLMLGYSYDWYVHSIGKYVGGSHEVTLSYSFGMQTDRRQKIFKSVRFL